MSDTRNILKHWREAVPNDRFAHLIRDTERAFTTGIFYAFSGRLMGSRRKN